jgi:hypothetical protein
MKFGEAEKSLALNWPTLAVSLSVASLAWVGTHLVPALESYGGALASLSGLLSLLVPVLIVWLRNNSDLLVDRKVK